MNYLVKAGLSVSALLIAGQAQAADFLLSSAALNTADANHFNTQGAFSFSDPEISAVIANKPASNSTFTDRYIFSVPYLASLGSGSVTSPNALTLSFGTGLTAAITITEYAASQSFLTDLYTNGYLTTNQSTYNTELSTVQTYITNNAGNVLATNTATANGTGGTTASLGGISLNNQSFYVITVTGTSTTGSYGGSATATAVPEPATWAMLLAGFGIVGFAMRRRSNQNVKVSFA